MARRRRGGGEAAARRRRGGDEAAARLRPALAPARARSATAIPLCFWRGVVEQEEGRRGRLLLGICCWEAHAPAELPAVWRAASTTPKVDVVDTTWMQAGQPAGDPDIAINTLMRHSHFMINSLFVDDLVELLVSGKAAAHRTRQLRRRDGSEVFHLDVGASIE